MKCFHFFKFHQSGSMAPPSQAGEGASASSLTHPWVILIICLGRVFSYLSLKNTESRVAADQPWCVTTEETTRSLNLQGFFFPFFFP